MKLLHFVSTFHAVMQNSNISYIKNLTKCIRVRTYCVTPCLPWKSTIEPSTTTSTSIQLGNDFGGQDSNLEVTLFVDPEGFQVTGKGRNSWWLQLAPDRIDRLPRPISLKRCLFRLDKLWLDESVDKWPHWLRPPPLQQGLKIRSKKLKLGGGERFDRYKIFIESMQLYNHVYSPICWSDLERRISWCSVVLKE